MNRKGLEKTIKYGGYLYFKRSSRKIYPRKIGKWNLVEVVLFTIEEENRVVDLKYVLTNTTTSKLNF